MMFCKNSGHRFPKSPLKQSFKLIERQLVCRNKFLQKYMRFPAFALVEHFSYCPFGILKFTVACLAFFYALDVGTQLIRRLYQPPQLRVAFLLENSGENSSLKSSGSIFKSLWQASFSTIPKTERISLL